MFKDIGKFLVLFFVVLFSFSIGLHKLYQYYKGMVRNVNGKTVEQSGTFLTYVANYTLEVLFSRNFKNRDVSLIKIG